MCVCVCVHIVCLTILTTLPRQPPAPSTPFSWWRFVATGHRENHGVIHGANLHRMENGAETALARRIGRLKKKSSFLIGQLTSKKTSSASPSSPSSPPSSPLLTPHLAPAGGAGGGSRRFKMVRKGSQRGNMVQKGKLADSHRGHSMYTGKPSMAGYLLKRGSGALGLVKIWRRRWFKVGNVRGVIYEDGL